MHEFIDYYFFCNSSNGWSPLFTIVHFHNDLCGYISSSWSLDFIYIFPWKFRLDLFKSRILFCIFKNMNKNIRKNGAVSISILLSCISSNSKIPSTYLHLLEQIIILPKKRNIIVDNLVLHANASLHMKTSKLHQASYILIYPFV